MAKARTAAATSGIICAWWRGRTRTWSPPLKAEVNLLLQTPSPYLHWQS